MSNDFKSFPWIRTLSNSVTQKSFTCNPYQYKYLQKHFESILIYLKKAIKENGPGETRKLSNGFEINFPKNWIRLTRHEIYSQMRGMRKSLSILFRKVRDPKFYLNPEHIQRCIIRISIVNGSIYSNADGRAMGPFYQFLSEFNWKYPHALRDNLGDLTFLLRVWIRVHLSLYRTCTDFLF